MIVCHCNVITRREIEEAIDRLLDEDPWRLIVPNLIYHELERRGRCCGCFPNVIDIIQEKVKSPPKRTGPAHSASSDSDAPPGKVLTSPHHPVRRPARRKHHERRRRGHRAA